MVPNPILSSYSDSWPITSSDWGSSYDSNIFFLWLDLFDDWIIDKAGTKRFLLFEDASFTMIKVGQTWFGQTGSKYGILVSILTINKFDLTLGRWYLYKETIEFSYK